MLFLFKQRFAFWEDNEVQDRNRKSVTNIEQIRAGRKSYSD